LMAEIRQAIEDDRFDDFVVEFYARMGKPVPPLQLDPTQSSETQLSE
ncbi:MAG: tRNA guanosine(34) transglycosylase Tgt, partial [Haemophilus parainfluenzae]|nr:tRNA guanosine(34) transglycosylase Tgt [Haemophilus parainfluenzae]